ncbi:hypothetical protein A2Y26_00820 [candidate division CPR2 bacterium GWD2_39_7]|nr:MAG: hypothetical protein UT60_C0048G0003 [candidate division CPR2 bacterium GW2011_GWD2_39_7]OGB71203.1 MAG: hypothetical protein A2Y26_00820 [candidate division CPR2 bacterium GWD2_39_7]
MSISSSDITLRAEGKKIIPYSFETIIVPEVRNEKIDLKISEIKIFGLPGNVIKKEIENILNKEVSTKINENAKIKNIELKPSKLLVKGEML